jgi:hypothetical protein
MTYRAQSGRQFIAMATGGGTNAALVAWALKSPTNRLDAVTK